MKLLQRFIVHKYPISLSLFLVWVLFFDGNSAIFIYKQYNELKNLKLQEAFLSNEIAEMKEQKENLFSDDDKLETYARENYYFKKDDEDIFVIEDKKD
jgi:cell division protein FtsB